MFDRRHRTIRHRTIRHRTVRHRTVRRSGCSLLALTTLVTCVLLVCNRTVAAAVYRLAVPAAIDDPRLRTVLLMLAMVGLLLPEWWLLDALAGRLRALYHRLQTARHAADS